MPADTLTEDPTQAHPPEATKTREAKSPEPALKRGGGAGVLIAGGLLAGLGIAAVTFPYLATFAIEIIIAALIGASGLIQLYQAFGLRRAPHAFRRGLSGLLWLAAGVIFLISPFAREGALLSLVAALIGADGVLRVVEGVRLRGRERGWGWLILTGASSLGLAALVAAGLPQTAYWAIGILLGLTLVIDGAALVLAQRQAPS